MAGAVPLGAPVDVPARVHEHGLALHLPPAKRLDIERATVALRDPDDDALQIGDRFEWEVGDVLAVLVTMRRRVDVGPGVGEQVDLPDLKARARAIAGPRGVARKPVADHRGG